MFFCDCLNIVGKISDCDGTNGFNSLTFGVAPAVSDIGDFKAYEFLKSVNIQTTHPLGLLLTPQKPNLCVYLCKNKTENPSHSHNNNEKPKEKKKMYSATSASAFQLKTVANSENVQLTNFFFYSTGSWSGEGLGSGAA
jgi:hypothetical protein